MTTTATLPAALRDLAQKPRWVIWQYEIRDGKRTKVPLQPDGKYAKSNDPTTWSTFAEVAKARRERGLGDGVGTMLSPDDDVVGIDIDHCRDATTGVIESWALDIVHQLASYSEITPSGTGLRIFVRGALPPGGRKFRIDAPSPDGECPALEMYDSNRYLTVTADRLAIAPETIERRHDELAALHHRYNRERVRAASPPPPPPSASVTADDRELLEEIAFRAKNGAEIKALWDGDSAAYGGDASAGDLALANHLLYYTGGDHDRADRMFRSSARMREKWDVRHRADGATYGRMTLEKALSELGAVYDPGAKRNGSGASGGTKGKASEMAVDDAGAHTEVEWEEPSPLGNDAPAPLPVDVLPAWVRDQVVGVAHSVEVPTDLALTHALGSMAIAVQGKVIVRPRSDDPEYMEPLNLYLVCALPSGLRKTETERRMAKPVRAEEARLTRDTQLERAQRAEELKLLEGRRKHLETQAAKEADETERQNIMKNALDIAAQLAGLEPPVAPRLLFDDATPEAQIQQLALHGGRMGVSSSEGTIFENAAGRYSDQPNVDVLLHGHASVGEIRQERVSRDPVVIPNPTITLALSVQPDVLTSIGAVRQFRGRGLVARIGWTYPADNLGDRAIDTTPVPPIVAERYAAGIDRLFRIPEPERAEDGRPQPHELTFSPAAERTWNDFRRWHERRLGAAGDLFELRDWGSKLTGLVVRLAGLLHVADHEGLPTLEIEAGVVERAICLGDALVPHAQRAYAAMRLDSRLDDARYVLAKLKAWDDDGPPASFSKRELHRRCRAFRLVRELDAPLAALVEHGYVRPNKPPDGPGRPSESYAVSPIWRDKCARTHEPPGIGAFVTRNLRPDSDDPPSLDSDPVPQKSRAKRDETPEAAWSLEDYDDDKPPPAADDKPDGDSERKVMTWPR